jgi:X-linked retinitis pigmentosa GTPase regulator
MRMFLPIKGPGGRYLTPREKVALLILGVTLILCALTLLAGDGAYTADGTRNPVSAFVAFLCRTFGGGIIALYALVLVWSGLIYFKGERVVDMRPLSGRLFAALCVTLGISGVLGIAHLETAGSLGLTVGAAIGNTFGATLGFPILIVLMLLGVHLAGQGAWSAMREPVRATATTAAPGGLGFGLKDAPQGRFAHPPLPDDGDPSADERTLAITKAMEEIERSKGVTIVDVQPTEDEDEYEDEEEFDDRPSIGEEVDEVADIDDDTEESDVRRGVAAVEQALAGGTATEHIADDEDVEEEAAADDEEEADYGSDRHGFVPVPPEVAAAPEDDECVEAVFVGDREEEDEGDEEDEIAYADASDEEEAEYDDEYEEGDDDEEALADEVDDVETYEDEDEEEESEADDDETAYDEEYEDEDDGEADDDETAYDEEYEDEEAEADEEYDEDEDEGYEDEIAEADDEVEDEAESADDDEGEDEEEEDESGGEWVQAEFGDEPAADAEPEGESDEDESYESVVAGQADGAGAEDDAPEEDEEDEDDPYAQGGLLRRLKHGAAAGEGPDDEDRPYTAFDWRGRPLE